MTSRKQDSVVRTDIRQQPVFTLVDAFEETIAYTRSFNLPFNMVAICTEEDPDSPSEIWLPERDKHMYFRKNGIYFTTCNTPIRLRYTRANTHLAIHFQYEILPGIDLFYGIRNRFHFMDPGLAGEVRKSFAEPDPVIRLARCQQIALQVAMRFPPEKSPLDFRNVKIFEELLYFVRNKVDAQVNVQHLSARMGWSEGYFHRRFSDAFRMTPKDFLERALFAKAARLLADPEMNVKQAAAELAFSSQYNFSRFFKR